MLSPTLKPHFARKMNIFGAQYVAKQGHTPMHTQMHIVMAVSDMLCVTVLRMEAALRLTDLKTSDSASNCF